MNAHTLADLVPLWLAAPMQYEPGEKWKYTQSGINTTARIVEIVSGKTYSTSFSSNTSSIPSRHEGHHLLHDRRPTRRPAGDGVCEEQGDRRARSGPTR